jgi:signal transduction histidine kinase
MISAAQGTLARERTVAEYRETLETCLATAQQMRQLTQSLLELARLEAGQAGLARHRLDLAHLVKACTNRIRPLAQERGITIRLDLRPAPVLGDAERLSRVLTNLLSNAIEYNRDQGEIRVESRTELGAAIVIVSDTGQGMPADDLPHVFEHFYRGDKARSGSGAEGHVGLGLAIAKGIVEAHGGAITVTSKVGEGSVLTVRLPAGWGGAPREAPAQSGERSGEVPQ